MMKYWMKKETHNNLEVEMKLAASLLLLGFLLAFPNSSLAEEDEWGNSNLMEVRADPPGIPERPVPFGLGEQIVMHVSFGIIPAGKAKLEVVDTVRIGDQLTYRVVSTARSAKGFDWVYKVRDSIETWIDADSIYSHKFRKKLREGNYKDEKLVLFNLADSTVSWWDDGESRDPIDVEPYVQDVFSAGFKTRTLPLEVGDTLYIRTHDVKKTYDLLVIVHARETVETLAGTFDCFKTEPIQKSGGLFKKERKARLFVWVTADDRRIPVMMTSKASFGTFTVQLESYTPPYYTVPIKRPVLPPVSAPFDSLRSKL
jgi:hypothetical protein